MAQETDQNLQTRVRLLEEALESVKTSARLEIARLEAEVERLKSQSPNPAPLNPTPADPDRFKELLRKALPAVKELSCKHRHSNPDKYKLFLANCCDYAEFVGELERVLSE